MQSFVMRIAWNKTITISADLITNEKILLFFISCFYLLSEKNESPIALQKFEIF